MDRKWLPNFGELIDRLSIHQLKEVFIPEYKEKYSREMQDIQNDIDIIIKEKDIKITAEMIRTIIVLAQMNEHIWYNESKARSGKDQDIELLKLTHGINGIRNKSCNYLLYQIGDVDRFDLKTDCLAAEFKDWETSLFEEDQEGSDNKEKKL